jgi:eukaryotic-like serine/threonine-protein kinase
MADATATPSAAPLLFGRYRVLEQAGEWRLAAAYVANDERLRRKVLLHLLRKELMGQESFRQRFLAEASANARVSHPALLEVFDSGEAANRPYMVTEYVGGRPLRELGALTLDHALLYMRQVAGAVALCQSRSSPEQPLGAAHPPISSSNVLLVDEGRVKLVESWTLPLAQVPLDMAAYRPPERSQGQPPSSSSVVYSLGLLLYELITGQRPIEGSDPRAVAAAHLTTRIPPLAQSRPRLYLPSLDQLLDKAHNRFPEQRFANAQALADALEAFWREMAATTQRFEVPVARPARPGMGGGAARRPVNPPTLPIAAQRPAQPLVYPQAEAPARRPAPDPDVAYQADDSAELRPINRASRQRNNLIQAVVGWFVVMLLLLGAGLGGYVGAGYILRQVANIELPSLPSLPLPELGGLFGQPPADTIWLVNTEQGLYLRDAPGVNTNVLSVLPNQTVVRQVEGPTVVDAVEWVRVVGDLSGQPFEGWVSLKYLIAER